MSVHNITPGILMLIMLMERVFYGVEYYADPISSLLCMLNAILILFCEMKFLLFCEMGSLCLGGGLFLYYYFLTKVILVCDHIFTTASYFLLQNLPPNLHLLPPLYHHQSELP